MFKPAFFVVFFLTLFGSSFASAKIPTLEDFAKDPDVFDAEFSPDGRYLAVISKSGDFRHVTIRDFEKPGFPVTGVLKEKIIRPFSLTWANNERLIVNLLVPQAINRIIKKESKESDFDLADYPMFNRSISMDIAAKDIVVLMENKYSLRNNTSLSQVENFLPDDKEHIIMPAWGRRYFELYKVNIYTGFAEKLMVGGKRTLKILTDDKGQIKYKLDYWYYSKVLKVFQLTKDKNWKQVNQFTFDPVDDDSLKFEGLLSFGIGKNNELIYRERNEDSGFYEIVQRNSKDNTKTVIASEEKQDIRSLITDSRTKEFIGYTIQKDLIRSKFFEHSDQQVYDHIAKKLEPFNFYFISGKEQNKRVIVFAYGMDNAGQYFVYDYQTKKLSFLANARKSLSSENLSMPAQTVYKTRDGEKIRMYVLFPPGYNKQEKAPLVVLPHGGPHSRDSATFDHFAQFLSTRGYVVVQPNFRGSSGYGKKFEEAGHKQWGGLMQDDLTDATAYMIKNGYVDKNKICIVGGSYGGYAALMGLIKTPELFQCGVSINGVTHLKDQISFDLDSVLNVFEDMVAERIYKTIGDPDKDSKMLDENSPALNADKINKPLLVLAGKKDDIVPIAQSEMLVEELRDLNKLVEYEEFETADHHLFYHEKNLKKAYATIEKFLEKHLK